MLPHLVDVDAVVPVCLGQAAQVGHQAQHGAQDHRGSGPAAVYQGPQCADILHLYRFNLEQNTINKYSSKVFNFTFALSLKPSLSPKHVMAVSSAASGSPISSLEN